MARRRPGRRRGSATAATGSARSCTAAPTTSRISQEGDGVRRTTARNLPAPLSSCPPSTTRQRLPLEPQHRAARRLRPRGRVSAPRARHRGEEHHDSGPGQARRVPRPVRRRPGRHDRGREHRRRRPARPVPGPGRRARRRPTSSPPAPAPTPRYVAEWLRGQAAGGYVEYDADGEHVLADRGAGVRPHRPGRPALPARRVRAGARHAARRSRRSPTPSAPASGVGWHEHDDGRCSRAARGSSGPATSPTSCRRWIPALDGVAAKLEAGARVADVGCGHGASTILMAQAFPTSHVRAASTTTAGRSSGPASAPPTQGSATASRFEVATRARTSRARLRPRRVLRLPARHGRPGRRGAPRARGARARTARGCSSSRSPATRGGQPEPGRPDLLRLRRPSCACRTPSSQDGRARPSARRRARRAIRRGGATQAGFTRFRRAAETPFNLVFEARP